MPWPSSCQVAWLILLATSSCGALAEWLQAIRSSKEVTRRCSMRSCGKPGQHIRHDVPQRYQAISRWSKAAPPTSPSCIEPHKHTGWWGWHIHWGSRSAFFSSGLGRTVVSAPVNLVLCLYIAWRHPRTLCRSMHPACGSSSDMGISR